MLLFINFPSNVSFTVAVSDYEYLLMDWMVVQPYAFIIGGIEMTLLAVAVYTGMRCNRLVVNFR